MKTGITCVNNVVSLSGGKDSTAMLHMMLERGEPIHSVVFFDTGWEFPEMLEHIDEVEQKTGLQVVRLHPAKSYHYWMYEHVPQGKHKRVGCGWPFPQMRWCTKLKIQTINKYLTTLKPYVSCIGFASDELRRIKSGPQRYPLIEYGITEAEALKYCRKLGYTWGGLYDIFSRVSCWCCPLQSLRYLRLLRKHRPELWQKLIAMELRQPPQNKGFKEYATVIDLDSRFSKEEKLLPYFGQINRSMYRFANETKQLNFFPLI